MKNFLKRYLVKIPENIEVFHCDERQILLVSGPFGKKILKLQVKLELLRDENVIRVLDSTLKKASNKNKKTVKSLRGTTVALLKQSFLEVSTVICKKLNLVGVGFKAFPIETKLHNLIHLKLGFSHSIYFKVPEMLDIRCHKTDKLFISGNIINQVSQVAALVRSCKTPEPYKGKGVSYINEIIKLKEGKKV